MEVIAHDDKVMQEKAPLLTILRQNIHQKLRHAIGLEKRGVRLLSRIPKMYALMGQLAPFSPGLKARSLEDKACSRV